jgi:hypothetical protein
MAPGQSRLASAWMYAGSAGFGVGLGIISRMVRPLFDYSIHWEALASIIVLAAIVAVLAVANRQLKPGRGLAMLEAETLLLWAGFAGGWSILEGRLWDDLLVVCALWCGGCGIGGAALLAVARRVWPAKQWPTRNCPECGYLLVGLSEKRCPECGRPFTLEELGVTEADLRV